MNTTRRKFLGMLGASAAVGGTGSVLAMPKEESGFRDLDAKRLYSLRTACKTEVAVNTGSRWSEDLVGSLMSLEEYGGLEYAFQCLDFAPLVFERYPMEMGEEPEEILVTGSWMREYWRRHVGGEEV